MTTTADNLAAALREALSAVENVMTEPQLDARLMSGWTSRGRASRWRDALAAYDSERKAPPGAGFRVRWEIDSEAESPEAAAREAWDAMRRPDSTACVFDVRDESGNVVQIDLAERDAEALELEPPRFVGGHCVTDGGHPADRPTWRRWYVTGTVRGQTVRGMHAMATDSQWAIEKVREYFKGEPIPRGTKWTATEAPE